MQLSYTHWRSQRLLWANFSSWGRGCATWAVRTPLQYPEWLIAMCPIGNLGISVLSEHTKWSTRTLLVCTENLSLATRIVLEYNSRCPFWPWSQVHQKAHLYSYELTCTLKLCSRGPSPGIFDFRSYVLSDQGQGLLMAGSPVVEFSSEGHSVDTYFNSFQNQIEGNFILPHF